MQTDMFDALSQPQTKGYKSSYSSVNGKCPHCGASMKMYWHRMTPHLAKTLVKIYTAISSKGENKIHPHKEMELSTSEHMNMTKLRFHGLIAKVKEKGEVERGYWLITRKGAEFLKGEVGVAKRVQTFRNKVVNHEFDYVYIKQVLGSVPYIESSFDFDLFKGY